jgi:hypothetical protein
LSASTSQQPANLPRRFCRHPGCTPMDQGSDGGIRTRTRAPRPSLRLVLSNRRQEVEPREEERESGCHRVTSHCATGGNHQHRGIRPRGGAFGVRKPPWESSVPVVGTYRLRRVVNCSSDDKGSTAPQIAADCLTCIGNLGENLPSNFALNSSSRRLN